MTRSTQNLSWSRRRALERDLVLLDRAELGRGLGADDREQVLRRLLGQLATDPRPWAAPLWSPTSCVLRGREIHLGAQAERVVGREVLVPVLVEDRQVLEVVLHPVRRSRPRTSSGSVVVSTLHQLSCSQGGQRARARSRRPRGTSPFSVCRVSTNVRRRVRARALEVLGQRVEQLAPDALAAHRPGRPRSARSSRSSPRGRTRRPGGPPA